MTLQVSKQDGGWYYAAAVSSEICTLDVQMTMECWRRRQRNWLRGLGNLSGGQHSAAMLAIKYSVQHGCDKRCGSRWRRLATVGSFAIVTWGLATTRYHAYHGMQSEMQEARRTAPSNAKKLRQPQRPHLVMRKATSGSCPPYSGPINKPDSPISLGARTLCCSMPPLVLA